MPQTLNLEQPAKYYPSKLLLFGEYAVLYGFRALSLPFSGFSGTLKTDSRKPDSSLQKLGDYLNQINGSLNFKIDLDALNKQINEGLYFDSNIPRNYGIGSSGALVASVFDTFRFDKSELESLQLSVLKDDLSQIESFFHGKSSGIDPLVSLMQKPVLIENNRVIIIDIPKLAEADSGFFIVDSETQGKTSGLVNGFINRMEDKTFADKFSSAYMNYSNSAIQNLLSNDVEMLFENITMLSAYQLKAMSELIPLHIQNYFKMGLDSNKFALKICGSGGGGFFLGFSKDKEFIEQVFNHPVYFL